MSRARRLGLALVLSVLCAPATAASFSAPQDVPPVTAEPASEPERPEPRAETRASQSRPATAAGEAPGGAETEGGDATGGFRVVVHATNPVTSLPRTRAARMFRRQIKSWDDFAPPVAPVDREEDAPVRVAFTRAVHQKRVSSITEYWFRMIFSGRGTPPPKLGSDLAVLRFVAENPGAIGYVGPDCPLDDAVKVVPITDS